MRILILEKRPDGCAGLIELLKEEHQIEQARRPGDLNDKDLVIITRSFEPSEAREFAAKIREKSPTIPLLILTKEGAVEERVDALQAGADDALPVPFAGSQMMARVDALERRAKLIPKTPQILEQDGCFIDLDRARASRGDQRTIELTHREVEILRWLYRHRSKAVSREELLEHVFQVSPEAQTRSVDMAIAVLRKKLERDPKDPQIIVSIKGLGYAWSDQILTQT